MIRPEIDPHRDDRERPGAAPERGRRRRLAAAVGAILATTAMVLPALTAPAQAQEAKKPNILFIMGDDIGWMQPSIYHRGLMVGETPNIDRIGHEGAMFTDYYAEQSCTAGRNAFFTGMHPLRTGMIPPQLPGSPSYLRPGTPALAKFLLRSRLHHRRVRQEPPRRPHRCAADRARLPGVLGLPLPPRRDAAGELPRHQQDARPSRPSRRRARTRRSPACPRSRAPSIPKTTTCLTPPRPVLWCKSSDGTAKNQTLQGRRPADPGAVEDGGRGDLGQGHRLPRPQRPEEDRQAVLRLVQPGAHARHDRAVGQVRWRWSASRAARTGASTKPA